MLPGWTRSYSYDESSLIDPTVMSNRLSKTVIDGVTEPYTYDSHGNIASMPHLSRMDWDFHDQLRVTSRQIKNDVPPPTYCSRVHILRLRRGRSEGPQGE